MKVVLTSPYYPPNLGGVEVHVRNLANGLLGRGFDVEVITSSGRDVAVKVRKVPSIPIPYSPIPIVFPKVEGDLYHSHIPSPFFAKEVARRNLRPHVITYHNDVVIPERVNGYRIPPKVGSIIGEIAENVMRSVLESADAIIATTKDYADTSPILKDFDVTVIPNAIDLDRYEFELEKEDYVIYVGRLVEYKGLSILMRAMRTVQKSIPIKLIVVGDGEDRIRFERLARTLDLKVEFEGRVSEDRKIELIKKAKLLVLPSKSRLEAFGIVLLEAMACGTPVVGSNIAGVRCVAKEGGLIFYDVDDLAEKILRIVTNDGLAKALGRRGRKVVEEKYNWKVVLSKVIDLYSSLI